MLRWIDLSCSPTTDSSGYGSTHRRAAVDLLPVATREDAADLTVYACGMLTANQDQSQPPLVGRLSGFMIYSNLLVQLRMSLSNSASRGNYSNPVGNR